MLKSLKFRVISMSFIFYNVRQVRCHGAYDMLWCVWRFGDSRVK